MTIQFSTTTAEVRTLENHRKAVEEFTESLKNTTEDEARPRYEELLDELSYAQNEVADLDGSNKRYGIVYDCHEYEVENLYEDLVEAWAERFGDDA